MYEFNVMLKLGEKHEADLDVYFSKWYRIERVNMELQRLGVDRLFNRPDGTRISVEYKADDTAARTGNAFIETVSVDNQNKPGWALSSIAQVLIYYIPPLQDIYIIRMLDLKMDIEKLVSNHEVKQIPNGGYMTEGIPVSIDNLQRYIICKLRFVPLQSVNTDD